ncbi:VgrG protein [Actinokineospora spheciospongiae]|uniref:VgrG protein n=1 Tax=Actinokineospora spheciospongiae TaxID=909613 RepID=W7J498_9PSEU|nr:VgrG protein [Actinokineospora spheciospongiae]
MMVSRTWPAAVWDASRRRDRGAVLRAAREHLGWSQAHLGQRFGCTPSAISRMENGRRRALDQVDVAARMAAILGLPAHAFGAVETTTRPAPSPPRSHPASTVGPHLTVDEEDDPVRRRAFLKTASAIGAAAVTTPHNLSAPTDPAAHLASLLEATLVDPRTHAAAAPHQTLTAALNSARSEFRYCRHLDLAARLPKLISAADAPISRRAPPGRLLWSPPPTTSQSGSCSSSTPAVPSGSRPTAPCAPPPPPATRSCSPRHTACSGPSSAAPPKPTADGQPSTTTAPKPSPSPQPNTSTSTPGTRNRTTSLCTACSCARPATPRRAPATETAPPPSSTRPRSPSTGSPQGRPPTNNSRRTCSATKSPPTTSSETPERRFTTPARHQRSPSPTPNATPATSATSPSASPNGANLREPTRSSTSSNASRRTRCAPARPCAGSSASCSTNREMRRSETSKPSPLARESVGEHSLHVRTTPAQAPATTSRSGRSPGDRPRRRRTPASPVPANPSASTTPRPTATSRPPPPAPALTPASPPWTWSPQAACTTLCTARHFQQCTGIRNGPTPRSPTRVADGRASRRWRFRSRRAASASSCLLEPACGALANGSGRTRFGAASPGPPSPPVRGSRSLTCGRAANPGTRGSTSSHNASGTNRNDNVSTETNHPTPKSTT